MFQRNITYWEEGIGEIRRLSRSPTVTGGMSRNDFVTRSVNAAVRSVSTGTTFSFLSYRHSCQRESCSRNTFLPSTVRGTASFVVSEDFLRWHHVLKPPKICLIMKPTHSDVGIGKFCDLSVLAPLSSYSRQAVLLHFWCACKSNVIGHQSSSHSTAHKLLQEEQKALSPPGNT